MSENWVIQVSPKTADGTLINIRAQNPEELGKYLEWATQNAGLITGAAAQFTGVTAATAAFPNAQVQPTQAEPQPWQQPQAAPPAFAPQAAPAAAGGKVCAHGPMTPRSGNKNGKDWSGWFCPTPRGTANQCAPVFGNN